MAKKVSKLAKSLMTKKSDQALKLDWEKLGPTKRLINIQSIEEVECELSKIRTLTGVLNVPHLDFKTVTVTNEKLRLLISKVK